MPRPSLAVLLALLLALALPPARPAAAAELRGTVRSTSGAALPGAQVWIYTAAPRTGTATLCPGCYPDCGKRREAGRDGGFVVRGLSDSLLFRVLVISRGFEPLFLDRVDPAAGSIEPRLEPRSGARRPGTVRGVVTDAFRMPVAGAVVKPIGWSRLHGSPGALRFGDLPGDPLDVTDDRGEFALAMADTGVAWFLRVEARNLAPRVFGGVTAGRPWTLELSDGALLSGTALRDGSPLAGVRIGLVQADRRAERFTGAIEIGTDSSGRFGLVNVPARESVLVYGIMESMPPGTALPVVRVLAPADDSLKRLPPMATVAALRLSGRVILGDGGPIPPGTRLMIGRARAWDYALVPIASDGSFQYAGIPPGEGLALGVAVRGHHLSPRSTGYSARDPFKLEIPPGARLDDVEIVLDRGDPPVAGGMVRRR